MSVLIKGINVHRGRCYECPCLDREYGDCNALKKDVHYIDEADCPLIELPDHGDLIDRDALRKDWRFSDSCSRCERDAYRCQYYEEMSTMDVCGMIDDARVVIPAERSEDGEQ